jgi:hypothetical protein
MSARTFNRRKGVWTKDEVVASIVAYVERHGRVPAATDFNPSDCRRSAHISARRSMAWLERADHWYAGEYPYPRTVAVLFGSWSAGIVAAGFRPYRLPLDVEPVAVPAEPQEAMREAWRAITHAKGNGALRGSLHALATAALAWADALPDDHDA